MRRRGIAVVAVLLLLGLCSASDAGAWTARISGAASLDDRLHDVARDPSGDVVTLSEDTVTKHARVDGAPLWRTRLVDREGTLDYVVSLATDASGDVVVIGGTSDPGAANDAVVWKLSGADGRELWRFRFDGPGRDADYATDVAVDASGDVIVGGVSHLIAEDMLAIKIDGETGLEKWHAVVPGPVAGQDQGLAVAIDAHGDVAVVGDATTAGPVDRFAAIKLRGTDGELLWRAFAAGPDDNGQASGAAFDAAGDLVVVGSIAFAATGFDVAVVKLDGATGAERWHRYVDGSAHDFDFGAQLTVSASGDVVAVGGVVNTGSGHDVLVLRLGPDGSERWRRDIDGGTARYDSGAAVSLVGDRVVLAGAIDGTSYDDGRFAALGLDGATGAETWRLTRDGDADGRDEAVFAVAASDGGVLIGGALANLGTQGDGLVLAVDAASGAVRWERNLNVIRRADGEATAVAVDAAGDAVVAGVTSDPATADDVTVVKLGGASGAELWRTRIDGPQHDDDWGGPVAVDGAGDVLVGAATLEEPPVLLDNPWFPELPPVVSLRVVKLDGATGSEKWRSSSATQGFVRADRLALVQDDPILAGWGGGRLYESIAAIARIDGVTGAERWRCALGVEAFGPSPHAVHVGVEPTGDVVAAVRDVAARIRGTSGVATWGPKPLAVAVTDLAVDRTGDVVVVGQSEVGFGVEKLSASTGASLWTVSRGAGRALAVRLDAAGDVFVAGAMQHAGVERLAVVRIDGASGVVRWERIIPAHGPVRGLTLALDPAGDVVVGGAAAIPGHGEDFAVRKLRGSDGRLRWRRNIDGGGRGNDRAQALALDDAGNVVAAGALRNRDGFADFAVVRFDGRTGSSR
ncbi:PQQ-like beta-propeller repeat protein [Candidatus Binatia bacterium]|nr:PQQ-like beta-propeller repeat protein [Candidatus Binatia bacterium]